MPQLSYAILPPPPTRHDGAAVLARLVDAIGFRFHHVTEGLRERDWSFQATPEHQSIRSVAEHVLTLLRRSAQTWGWDLGANEPRTSSGLRHAIDLAAWSLRSRLLASDSDTVLGEHWWLLHGPLADALTHVGQIATWRRQAGNPMPPMNWPQGRPR